MAHSNLAGLYVGTNGNYSGTNYRKKIDLIVMHHMAGVLTPVQCNNALKSRKGSIHYAIGNDGVIGYGIDEKFVAWHAGNWPINQRSIGIEVSNSKVGGDWPISDKAYKAAVKLVADIAKRNKLGKLVFKKNIGYHCLYASTSCPGPYFKKKFDQFIKDVNAINYPAPKDSFLPAKGYWGPGDTSVKVGQIATFMHKTFPSYCPSSILGNYYGKNLTASVKEFQRRTKLTTDGCVGPKTLAMLRKYGFKY